MAYKNRPSNAIKGLGLVGEAYPLKGLQGSNPIGEPQHYPTQQNQG